MSLTSLILLLSLLAPEFVAAEEISLTNRLPTQLRRPMAMCWIKEGAILATANERSGSVSLIEPISGEVREFYLSGRLVDVAWLPATEHLLVLDETAGELLFCTVDEETISIHRREPVGRGARHLAVSENGSLIAVSSVWDRQVTLVTGADDHHPPVVCQVGFEPGILLNVPEHDQLLVLDAFAGFVCIIDTVSGSVRAQIETGGHNISGAALQDGNRFLVTHQILNENIPTTAEEIASGAVIENVVSEFRLSTDNYGNIEIVSGIAQEIGVPSHGAADPASIIIGKNGDFFTALSGVDEVAILNAYGIVRSRIAVGNRPVDLLLSNDESSLYALNQLDDSIDVIDVVRQKVVRKLSLGPTPMLTSRERGEELFFDGHLSRFGWYSCQSCHVHGHTNGRLADTFGDGNSGAPKRVLTLLGGRDNNPWAWNGKMRSLHDQVLKSGETTMRGPGFSAKETNDVVAYLHSLEPPPPFRPATSREDQQLIDAGRRIFDQQDCSRCHVPPLTYTSDSVYDVGMVDEHGLSKFNPPSLRGVGFRRRFFHDGRAQNLQDVFVEYGHQLDDALSEAELQLLIRFLESL